VSAPTSAPRAALVFLCVAQFVLQLDISIVNIALHTIQGELHFQATTLQWVVTGYALTFGSLLLLGGRLGDVIGRRRLLLRGLWLFGLASLACGLAPNPALLIAARFVQGIGAAMMAPMILATLTSTFPEGPSRTRALGLWTAATAAGGTTGVVLGGVLTQYLGWRSIFLVNIPIIAGLLLLAHRAIPDLPGDRSRRLDVLGASTVTIAVAALIFAVSNGEQHGFTSLATLLSFAGFVVFTAAFVMIETTVAEPMMPFSFLANASRRNLLIVMFVFGLVYATYGYVIALYMQRVLGYSEVLTGFALVPSPVTLVLTSTQVTRRSIARIGPKATMIIGLASMAAGQLWLSRLTVHSSYLVGILPGLILTSIGGALALPSVTMGITSRLSHTEQGLAGGFLPTAQQIGAAVGLAVLASVAAGITNSHGGSLVAGYRASYLIVTGIIVLVILLVARTDLRGIRHRPVAVASSEAA
jgi:EmrB/QacA subfamily drug resistance transporter